MLTELSSPRGLPNASTICPWLRVSESAKAGKGSPSRSILITARSVCRSLPINPAFTEWLPTFEAAALRRTCQPARALDHVSVGHDVTIGGNQYSRPRVSLLKDHRFSTAFYRIRGIALSKRLRLTQRTWAYSSLVLVWNWRGQTNRSGGSYASNLTFPVAWPTQVKTNPRALDSGSSPCSAVM